LADGQSTPMAEPLALVAPAGHGSIEQRLFAGMDAASIQLMADLEDKELSPKDRRETFRLIIEWLTKSKRLRQDDEDDLPTGVAGMRAYIAAEVAKRVKPGRSPPTGGLSVRHVRPGGPRAKPDDGEGEALAKALRR